MVWLLKRCLKCGAYTLKTDKCPRCGGALHVAHPAKFSPDDKYLKYRIPVKEQEQRAK